MSILPSHKGQFALDQFNSGYPKFAALLNVHPAFQNFRRFSRVRLRLLLLKQDELSSLEADLDCIDAQEQRKLNLGCARQDDNTGRKNIQNVLQKALTEYDIMVRDYHHILQLPNAAPRDVESIKNWVDGTGCIARAESEFLERGEDMANLAGTLDNAVHYVEILAEKIALRVSAHARKVLFLPEAMIPGRNDLTQDRNIFFMGPHLRSFSRAVTSCVASGILLAPVVVLFCVQRPLWRLVIIAVAVFFFLSALSTWTKARTIEIVTAGASYAAVLVVFTSASNALKPDSAARMMGAMNSTLQ